MNKLITQTLVAIFALFWASEAFSQAQYVGQYHGYIYISTSGAASTPEYPNRAAASIDNSGNFELFGGSLTGTVNNAGAITFAPSVFNFTTGTLAGGVITANASVSQGNGVNVNTRLELTISTGAAPTVPVGEYQLDQKRSLPLLPKSDMYAVAYGDGKFVQVGRSGVIYVSADGLNWTSPISPTTTDLNDIAYGGGKFVAVGQSGVIVYSSDAVNWTLTTYPRGVYEPAANLACVAYGNGVFAAGGLSSATLRSEDGVSWTVEGAKDAYVEWTGLDFVNGKFFYMGYRSGILGARFMTSTDGKTFTTPITVTPNKKLKHIAYLNGVYISAGGAQNSGGFRFTSNDGSGATEIVAPSSITSVTSDGTQFIASGYSNDFTSTDGLTWTIIPGSTGKGSDAVYGNGRVVFAETFRTSTDMVTWEGSRPADVPGGTYIEAMTRGNGMIVAGGGNGSVVSYDGINWEGSTQIAGFKNLITGNDAFFGLNAQGAGGAKIITRSGDGLDWETVFSSANTLRDIASGDDGYVVVGEANFLARSTNGFNWVEVFPKVSGAQDFIKVAYGNGTWITIMGNRKFRKSTDGGRTWTEAAYAPIGLRDIEFYDGQFVALGDNASILTTTDGVTWTTVRPQAYDGNTYTFIDRVAGKWIMGGPLQARGKALYSSKDLVSWTAEQDIFTQNYLAVTNIGPNIVFLTESHTILHSRIASQPLPFVISSPADPTVSVGGNLTLSGSFAGSNLTYQWFRSGTPLRNDGRISGATTPTLSITDLNGFDAGKYSLRAISGSDEAFTVPANVVLPALPKITVQPAPKIDTYPGFEEPISVTAEGTDITYQWRKNGVNIPSATAAKLLLTNLTVADAAAYDCVLASAGGTVISSPSVVNISTEYPDPALVENPSAPKRSRKVENTTRIDFPNNTNIRYDAAYTPWKKYSSINGIQDKTWVSPISGYCGDSYQMPNGNYLLMRSRTSTSITIQESGYYIMQGDGSAATLHLVSKNGSTQNILPYLIFTEKYTWIAGDFDAVDGHATNRLARLKADGTVDTTFSMADVSPQLPKMIWDDIDGGIILAIPEPSRVMLHKAYADGSSDPTIYQNAKGTNYRWNWEITGLAIASNGDFLIAGERFTFNNSLGKALWRYTRGGTFSSTPLTQYNLSGWNFQQLNDGRLIFIARETGSNIYKAYQFSENGGRKVIKTYAYNHQMIFENRPIPSQPNNTAGIFGTDSTQLAGTAPASNLVIITQPQDGIVQAGRPLTLSVSAAGSFPISYQWTKNGMNLPGANSSSLNLAFSEFANLAGNYSVTLTAANSTITSRTATVTDLGGGARESNSPQSGFDSWASQNGIPIKHAGPYDDADHDGVPNLLEYITGSNPMASSTLSTPIAFATVGGESYQTISIVRRIGLSGITMGAETSADMFRTAPVPAIEHGSPQDLGNGFERVTYRSTVPVSASPHGFIRIAASGN